MKKTENPVQLKMYSEWAMEKKALNEKYLDDITFPKRWFCYINSF